MVQELDIETQDRLEVERIRASLERHKADAQNELLARGIPITILRDGKVQRIYPDGHSEVIKELAR